MKLIPGLLLPVGLTLALWLSLRMPAGDFIGNVWMPAAAWILFIVLASMPAILARLFRIDGPTYGPVAFLVGLAIPAFGALTAAAALFVARYAVDAAPSLAEWASSPILGALFVIILLSAAASIALMGHRSIGASAGPLVDVCHPTMVSQPDPPCTATHLLSGQESSSKSASNP